MDRRLTFLLQTQNGDGGWGYFPAKQSWMEPTAYAILALNGSDLHRDAVHRAWKCLNGWRCANGSWRAGAQVEDATWVTALGLLVSAALGKLDNAGPASLSWLLPMSGQESGWLFRVFSYFHWLQTSADVSHRGWPWRPGTSAWIEPSAITVLALRKTLEWRPDARVRGRLIEGQDLILSRRDRDGGWNSGNPNVLGVEIPSYPETTAIALMGLQGRSRRELDGPLAVAKRYLACSPSPLATAWLRIALQCYGDVPALQDDPELETRPLSDVLLCALEALAHPAGNWRSLQAGGAT